MPSKKEKVSTKRKEVKHEKRKKNYNRVKNMKVGKRNL